MQDEGPPTPRPNKESMTRFAVKITEFGMIITPCCSNSLVAALGSLVPPYFNSRSG